MPEENFRNTLIFLVYGAFSTHKSSISATLVAACLFPDAVLVFTFSFHSLR